MEIFFNKIFGQGVAEGINGTAEGVDEGIVEVCYGVNVKIVLD